MTSQETYRQYWKQSERRIAKDLADDFILSDLIKPKKRKYKWLKELQFNPAILSGNIGINELTDEDGDPLVDLSANYAMTAPVTTMLQLGESIDFEHGHPARFLPLCLKEIEDWWEEYPSVAYAISRYDYTLRSDFMLVVFSHACEKCEPFPPENS